MNPRSFAFPLVEFSRNELPCFEVGPLARRSDVATPVRPVTGRLWLSPVFRCPASRQPSLRSAYLRGGGMLGLPSFAQAAMDDLAPAYYTGSRCVRVPAC